ncbi:hypothetical protein TRVA0_011S00584 [Trichomonascus vanleenenianus]|uniref:uncharacterized protein n=1 Tax=Trichomonascus vanleenenianus TaxID=2268995 RepID=UPI003ECA7B07
MKWFKGQNNPADSPTSNAAPVAASMRDAVTPATIELDYLRSLVERVEPGQSTGVTYGDVGRLADELQQGINRLRTRYFDELPNDAPEEVHEVLHDIRMDLLEADEGILRIKGTEPKETEIAMYQVVPVDVLKNVVITSQDVLASICNSAELLNISRREVQRLRKKSREARAEQHRMDIEAASSWANDLATVVTDIAECVPRARTRRASVAASRPRRLSMSWGPMRRQSMP